MIFNSVLMKAVTQNDKNLWLKVMDTIFRATNYIRSFPDKHRCVVECHSICRALGLHIPELKVVDGSFLGLETRAVDNGREFDVRCCDHSWLLTPDKAIIDPYPVGIIVTNPVLIPANGKYKWWGKECYIADHSVAKRVVDRDLVRKSSILLRFIRESEKLSE
ncbi:MAG: hypothetical protein ABI430_05240 [Candidatus Taylorbacteria bacterium]